MKGWMWDRGSGGKMSGESQQPAVSLQLLTSQLLPNFQFSAGQIDIHGTSNYIFYVHIIV